MSSTPFFRRRSTRWMAAITLLIAVAVVVGATTFGRTVDPMAGIPLFTVAKGPLTISITESGTIKSRQQEILKCEVEGGSAILSIIPEGTRVKKGDLLIELDGSKLTDQSVAQEIIVKNSEAAFIAATENLEIAKSQAKSDILKAEQDYRFAVDDLKKYEDGDYATDLAEKEAKVKLAEDTLKQAANKFDWSKNLFDAKYISKSEFESDDLSRRSADSQVKSAKNAVNLLKDFTFKRTMAQNATNIEQTRLALDRVNSKAKADKVQAEAARDAKKLEFDRQTSTMAKLKRMLEKTKIYATVDAQVVYATTGDGGWRFNREPLIEGSMVRERQDLICLPTTSSYLAEVKIHESSLEKLALGLPVRLTIDALPGKMFTGKVAKIAPLPDAGSMWMNPDMKVYNTEIFLDEDGENLQIGMDNLRTGMSCRAEIFIDRYADAIYVPVQSIVRIANVPTVFLPSPTGPQRRAVKLGLDNNSMARVVDGLKVGEKVLLSPPLGEGQSNEDSAAGSAKDANLKFPVAGATTRPVARPTIGPPQGAAPGQGRGNNGDNADAAAGQGDRGPASNVTPEQREAMRKAMENMTPEQREAMRAQRPRQGQGQGRGQGRGQGQGDNAPPAGGPR